MARFLSTSGISHHLEEIIKGSTRQLTLVSPYLRLNDRIRQLIQEKGRDGIEVRVLFGKEDLEAKEQAWLQSQPNVRLGFLKHLHAKCYLHESLALVTSMNLHQFSQVNNAEMGILVSETEDPELFGDVVREVARLIRAAEDDHPVVAATPADGACIRCAAAISLNPQRPYCQKCFATWQQYRNDRYPEKVCHICRRPFASTRRKPACDECYRRHKGSLVFPAAGASPAPRAATSPSLSRKFGHLLHRLGKRIVRPRRGR